MKSKIDLFKLKFKILNFEIIKSYKRKKYCETCGSTGSKSRKEPQCGKCNGRGVVIRQTQMGMMIQQVQTACDHCGGSGKSAVKSNDKCATCAGKSFLVSEETIEQTIEPGVVTEQKAVHKNMGNQCLESKVLINRSFYTQSVWFKESLLFFQRIFVCERVLTIRTLPL